MLNLAIACLSLVQPAIAQQPNTLGPYLFYLDAEIAGDGINRHDVLQATTGSLDYDKVVDKLGTHYEALGSGGLNWSGLSALVTANRQLSSSPTQFRAQIKRRITDRCKIRASGYAGMPLRLYIYTSSDGTIQTDSLLGGHAFIQYITGAYGLAGASGGNSNYGTQSSSDGGAPFGYGIPANGTHESGPINVTENLPFDLVQEDFVSAQMSTNSATGPLGTASSLFGHTFRLQGVVVKNTMGVVLTNFTITSQLGIDWKKQAKPAKLRRIDFALNPVVGGTTVNGTVTFDIRAEQGGQTVKLISKKPALAQVPSAITVPYLSTSSTFQIQTVPVGSTQTVDIVAQMRGVTRTRTLTLNPPSPS